MRSVPKPIATGAPLAAEVTVRSPSRGPSIRLSGLGREQQVAQDRAGEPARTPAEAGGGTERGAADGDQHGHGD